MKLKLRTVSEMVSEIKQSDPESPISECYLRRLLKQKEIKMYTSGRRIFVNATEVYKYFGEEVEK